MESTYGDGIKHLPGSEINQLYLVQVENRNFNSWLYICKGGAKNLCASPPGLEIKMFVNHALGIA